MKKLMASLLVSGLVLTGVSAGHHAEAATGNSMKTVQQINHGDQSLEKVRIGESIKSVLNKYSHPIYSYNQQGTEHYYEFRTHKGVLLVTTNGKKDKGHVTRVSMTYNHANGPTYKSVKDTFGNKAVSRVHYNKVTGNFGYIQKGKASYQFSSESPKDKNVILYRIDIAK
ncbi:SA0570 family protein [Staphylococcus caprae]|uniref:SA0570 family protein n=1 Tax=Staphylococcus caprae TaxID=29380 RepID=UPI001C83C6C2|nr:hypothetical protein [Staphylococcus caprae]MBX5319114.1 hypothetical protein [Staphylococcus caprae]MDI9231299.1 hypothetical protein [Staphylococcus caprae]